MLARLKPIIQCSPSTRSFWPPVAGQAIVQFARDDSTGVDYAIKFFLDEGAYRDEAAVYQTSLPSTTTTYRRAFEIANSCPSDRPPASRGLHRVPAASSLAPSRAATAPRPNSVDKTTMTKTGSIVGTGTLAAASAAYTLGTTALSSFGNRSVESRAAMSDGISCLAAAASCHSAQLVAIRENSAHSEGVPTFRPSSGRHLNVSPPLTTASVANPAHLPVSQVEIPASGGILAEHPVATAPGAETAATGGSSGAMLAATFSAPTADSLEMTRVTDATLYEGVDSDSGASEPLCMEDVHASSTVNCPPAQKPRERRRGGIGAAATEPAPGSSLANGDVPVLGSGRPGTEMVPLEEPVHASAWGDCRTTAAAAKFLPRVEALCEVGAAELVDPRGRPLPPCIVMEKGESLHDWSDRAQPDLFSAVSVRPLACPT